MSILGWIACWYGIGFIAVCGIQWSEWREAKIKNEDCVITFGEIILMLFVSCFGILTASIALIAAVEHYSKATILTLNKKKK